MSNLPNKDEAIKRVELISKQMLADLQNEAKALE